MRSPPARTISILLIALLIGEPASVLAQAAAPARASSWRAEPPRIAAPAGERAFADAPAVAFDSSAMRGHTGTGLLVGSVVGVSAAALFLAGFCSDADTKCEADEVGRALVFIAVPPALAGALIGTLIRTRRDA
ncbi:MAG TPA: hypothetical protein VF541_04905 [Longimicrobium sp.]|jgi:hypothetical protein